MTEPQDIEVKVLIGGKEISLARLPADSEGRVLRAGDITREAVNPSPKAVRRLNRLTRRRMRWTRWKATVRGYLERLGLWR